MCYFAKIDLNCTKQIAYFLMNPIDFSHCRLFFFQFSFTKKCRNFRMFHIVLWRTFSFNLNPTSSRSQAISSRRAIRRKVFCRLADEISTKESSRGFVTKSPLSLTLFSFLSFSHLKCFQRYSGFQSARNSTTSRH